MAAHLAHVAAIELGQILALEDDFAVSGLVELKDRPAGGRLAATRLTDETERLSGFDMERMPSTA